MRLKFNYTISEPLKISNLILFSVKSYNNKINDNFISLQEAYEKNFIEMKEINDEGYVPEINVKNKSNKYIFCSEGEMLDGCKQLRVLNSSVILSPFCNTNLPVSCVEAGRWNMSSNKFSPTKEMLFKRARTRLSEDVYEFSKSNLGKKSNQPRIWEEVEKKLYETKTDSKTQAINSVYQSNIDNIEKITNKIKIENDDVGVIYGIRNEIIGCDIYNNNNIFKYYFPKIVRSLCVEALDVLKNNSILSINHAENFLKEIEKIKYENHTSVCAGNEYRFNNDDIVSSFVSLEKKMIHLSVLKKDKINFENVA